MSETINVFDRASDAYEDWYRQPMGVQVLAAELKGLEALLPREGLGVDIGAGTGIFAERLSSEGRDFVCLDPSPGMLEKAAQRGLRSILGTGEYLPIRHGSLDFAYLVTVIEFLSCPLKALRSIKDAMKRDAPLVTLTVNRGSPWGKFYTELAGKGDPIFGHARLYEIEEVEALLKEAGLELWNALSTLTKPPGAEDVGSELIRPDPSAGVVLLKSKKAPWPNATNGC